MNQVPVFINCRDRMTPLVALLDYLERAGCERVYLLDNASTYPPLLEYYEGSPHTVIRLQENHDHKWFWESGLLDELGVHGRYVFSDPDTVPIEECPLDAIDYFGEVLDRYPAYKKVGFGLKIDDIPDHFRLKREVIVRQSRFWHRVIAPRLYEAPIDTTFALYRGPEHSPRPAIRTGFPYLVRHTTWYLDSENVPAEHRYYIEHEEGVSRWGREELGGGAGGPTPERARLMREKVERLAARSGGPAAVEPALAFPDFVRVLARLIGQPADVEPGGGEEMPGDAALAAAGVSVLDSPMAERLDELKEWWAAAAPGALVLVRGDGDEAADVRTVIGELGIPGSYLPGLEGAFLGVKP